VTLFFQLDPDLNNKSRNIESESSGTKNRKIQEGFIDIPVHEQLM
jgi:hypothetical protein